MSAIEECGERDTLGNLNLRKIVKESHGCPIACLAFNFADPDCGNILATAGGDIVSIYDNDHCGGHLDLCCVYRNEKTDFQKGGAVTSIAWLKTKSSKEETEFTSRSLDQNEALLAFGSLSGEIGFLSLSCASVVALLNGHTAAITNLSMHPRCVGLLASTSDDCTLRVWDYLSLLSCHEVAEDKTLCDSSLCTISTAEKPTAIGWNPSGDSLVFGTDKGRLFLVRFQIDLTDQKAFVVPAEENITSELFVIRGPEFKKPAIDYVAFVANDRLIAHDTYNRIHRVRLDGDVWAPTINVPNGGDSSAPKQINTKVGLSICQTYFCCGNVAGEVYVYNLMTGESINKLSMPRIKGAITAGAFSENKHNLISSTNDGIIWRWDHVKAQT